MRDLALFLLNHRSEDASMNKTIKYHSVHQKYTSIEVYRERPFMITFKASPSGIDHSPIITIGTVTINLYIPACLRSVCKPGDGGGRTLRLQHLLRRAFAHIQDSAAA